MTLLYRGLVVALVMDAVPGLTLVVWGKPHCLNPVLATTIALVVVVATIPLSFHTSSIDTLA